MNDGHFFEVAPADTSIVWEYINPLTRGGIKKIKVDNYPTYNAAFRAYRYTSDHPALKNKDLTAGKTITGYDPDYFLPKDVTFIKEIEESLKSTNTLSQNYPNPFTNSTKIVFEIESSKYVNVTIFDLSGNPVKILYNDNCSAGKYELNWDGTNSGGWKMPSGIYVYILMADNQRIGKKMIYFK
jgi:hypothetical protein